jgi:hypothetical protein
MERKGTKGGREKAGQEGGWEIECGERKKRGWGENGERGK